MNEVLALARPEIRALVPAAAQVNGIPSAARLHANENPWADEADVSPTALNRYFDGQPQALVEALAAHYGTSPRNVLVTRGSDEAIDLIVRAFSLSMHPGYVRPASLDLLAGTYTRTTSIGYTMTLSFTQGGALTGSDSRGCVFNGSVTVPDPTHNFYQVNATVTSCGILYGSYQGHGTVLDATAMQSWTGSMGCFQYGSGGWGGGMIGGMGGWWPYSGSNTVPTGTSNLFMFAMTDGSHAIMDALAR